jgi:hypothetical protein
MPRRVLRQQLAVLHRMLLDTFRGDFRTPSARIKACDAAMRVGRGRVTSLLHRAVPLERNNRARELVAFQRSRRRRTIPY